MSAALLGRVVVVAGGHPGFPGLVDALVEAGAFVAFVAADATAPAAHAGFRADPTDPQVWERVAPHVEQRLGPVDAVVVDGSADAVVRSVFLTDLRRRGHGDVLLAGAEASADDLLSLVAGTL
jgi:hypothetical protein